MKTLFRQPALIFWYTIFTALGILMATDQPRGVINDIVRFVRKDLGGLDFTKPVDDFIASAVKALLSFVNFDSRQNLIRLIQWDIDNRLILGIAVLVGLVSIWFLYATAVKSKNLFDDFLALAGVYLVVSSLGTLAAAYGFELLAGTLVKDILVFLIILLALVLSGGNLMEDRGKFGRVMIPVIVLGVILFTKPTVELFYWTSVLFTETGKIVAQVGSAASSAWMLFGLYAARVWWKGEELKVGPIHVEQPVVAELKRPSKKGGH